MKASNLIRRMPLPASFQIVSFALAGLQAEKRRAAVQMLHRANPATIAGISGALWSGLDV
jgi:hypothetical protein